MHDCHFRETVWRYDAAKEEEKRRESVRSNLNGVLVSATCPSCGSWIRAPYVQVKSIGIFACGCGTVVDANMASVTAQALIGLMNEPEYGLITPIMFTREEPMTIEAGRAERPLGLSGCDSPEVTGASAAS
jgi:hypothetical protein